MAVKTRSSSNKKIGEKRMGSSSSLLGDESKSISSLQKDYWNLILLIFLYLLQGVPLGLTFGSIPFLLKSKLSYSQLALFSLSSYPYSLKLLWSPIVDSLYVKSFGRRKSWIVPIQAITGAALIIMGRHIDDVLLMDEIPIMTLSIAFTSLVFLCATQDVAVDGWALTLLSDDNKGYASTAQTIGLNTGYFLSFTIFLALNSADFCNKYLRVIPSEVGGIELGGYLQFWGIMFLIVDVWLIFFQREKPEIHEPAEGIKSVYAQLWSICVTPEMRRLIFILMICKIGFIANDSVTGLKLLEKGFGKEDLAVAVLIDFPFQILFGYYAAKWSTGPRPLQPWLYAFYGRLAFALIGMIVVSSFPAEGVTTSYFAVVIISTVLSSFMSTVQFVGLGSFFTQISDPLIGGTYMTLLNTLSNLGGTWPRFFVLEAVDYFTDSDCSLPDESGNSFKCSNDAAKALCKALTSNTTVTSSSSSIAETLVTKGTCNIISDGYYIVGTFCFLIGFATLIFIVRPGVHLINETPDSAWRLKKVRGRKDTKA